MHYGSPKRRTEKGGESIAGEITTENSPNLGKERDIQIQEAQQSLMAYKKSSTETEV